MGETGQLTGPIAAVGMGAFGALFVTAAGDRIGRRPMLISTTLLYALFTGLTATSASLGQFVVYQFLARTFLIAEYATAVTIVAEEFPKDRRGRALGALTAIGAFGLPVVAVLHLALSDTRLGWRWLYLIGLIPLLIVAAMRTRLKETVRWQATRAAGRAKVPLMSVITGVHRRKLFYVSALFFLTHFALLGASTWWPLYASTQRGFSQGTITLLLVTAYPIGVSGYFIAGRLQDAFGRKRTGSVFLALGLVFGIATFQVTSPTVMFFTLVFAVFFGLGVNPVISAISSELFPTDIRATAVAMARSVFGTSGAILGPVAVGIMADLSFAARFPQIPILGNLGHSVSVAAIAYLPALFALTRLPETGGLELEEAAAAG